MQSSAEVSMLVLVVIDQQTARGMVARSRVVSGITFALHASVSLTAVWQVSKHLKHHRLQQERHVQLLSNCFFSLLLLQCPDDDLCTDSPDCVPHTVDGKSFGSRQRQAQYWV